MSSIDFIQVKNQIEASSREFAETAGKLSLSEKELEVAQLYLSYSIQGCHAAAHDLYESQMASPILLRAAEKIEEAAKPVWELIREGKERIEAAKTNPQEGPRAVQWLAMYYEDFNAAYAAKDRDRMKDAIEDINGMREHAVSQNAKNMLALCEERIAEIDPSGSLRHEVETWSGYLKDNFGKAAVGIGMPLAGMYIGSLVMKGARNLVEAGLGSEVAEATMLALSAQGFYRAVRSKDLKQIALSGVFLYSQISYIYEQRQPQKNPVN